MRALEGAHPFPVRPSITVPFACAMAFWIGCAIAYSSGVAGDSHWNASCAVASLAGAVLSLAGAVARKARPCALAGALFLVGLALGFGQSAAVHAAGDSFACVLGERADLVLLEDSRDFGFGETALVEARIGDASKAVFDARFGKVEPLFVGERMSANVTFYSVDYSQDQYAWNDGSCGQLKVKAAELVEPPFPVGALIGFRKRAVGHFGADDDAHALLQALVCGYRRNVSGTELYSRFQACGLAHLVAVSGAHLVIVTGLAAALLKRVRAPRKLTIAVVIAIMGSYFIVAGMPVSALRALAMSSLGLVSFFGKRRASSLNAIGIATFAIVSATPACSVSASFALSALSTVGIVLFGPLFQAWLERSMLRRFTFVTNALSLTVSASLLSQPYSCALFHQLPLVAPLANVVTAPLFPFVCGCGLVSCLIGAFSPVGAVSVAASVTSAALALVVGAVSDIPFANIPFAIDTHVAIAVSAVSAILLWALWPRPGWLQFGACGIAAVIAFLFFSASAANCDAIVMLDVGQGDAILVQSRGQRYLVDTGNQDSKLLEQLALNRVVHLDGAIVTHADDDHCGSVDALDKAVSVDRFLLAAGMLDCEGESARRLVASARACATEVVGLEEGDEFRVGAFTATVVWPHVFTEDGGNADSLCLLLRYDGDDDGSVDFTVLLTGDAEKDELAKMIESGAVGNVDVLKVGHHGSRNGSTEGEIRALSPEVALISCGAHNRYGHPTLEILDQLERVGAKTFRTDEDGAVRCLFAFDSITVECEHGR